MQEKRVEQLSRQTVALNAIQQHRTQTHIPSSPRDDSPASQTFALYETQYQKSDVARDLCRGKPKLRRLDRRASLGWGPKTMHPRAPRARSPGGSKLRGKPEAFLPLGRSPQNGRSFYQLHEEKTTVSLQVHSCERQPKQLLGNIDCLMNDD